MTSVLFKNAHIVDPVSGRDEIADILLENGTISSIGKPIAPSSVETIDLKEAIAAPGFCDMHVHLREPGYEHK
ncbi:MAG: dihydroorotase, partial [Chlorobi bacterium]|nr:dihydroorotase [Chlorobiota bacterium]